jgi:cysteinyl-tRNA synthetase, unknown class
MTALTALLIAIENGVAAALRIVWTLLRRLGGYVWHIVGAALTALLALPAAAAVVLVALSGLSALAAGAYALRDGPITWYEAEFDKRPLLKAQSWYYRLDKTDVDDIAPVAADLVVMDHAKNGGLDALTPAEVDRIRTRPDGSKRLVVSYISIGEAEEYRFYWKPEWTEAAKAKDRTKMPSWWNGENCAWPGNHAVRFWHPSWKSLIYGAGPESFIGRIVNAGFDGVYLDRVDIYEMFRTELKDPEAEMIRFVTELAATARRLKPGFLVIAQNAEDLLRFKHYRRVIDGLGKEDLLYGDGGTGARKTAAEIDWSYSRIKLLLRDRKPVFAVEYLVTRDTIAEAKLELHKLGLVPTNAHRSLDGRDPTMPDLTGAVTEGTPEHIAAKCDRTNAW